MEVLIFCSDTVQILGGILHAVEQVVPRHCIEVYRTLRSYSSRLSEACNGQLSIAVIFASGKGEVGEIIALRELLADRCTILILSEVDSRVIAKAHTLRPRFMTYADKDLRDLTLVLGKILSAQQKKRRQDDEALCGTAG